MFTRRCLALVFVACSAPVAAASPTRIEVRLEVDPAGAPGALWLELLAKRLPAPAVAAAAAERRPATPGDLAWIELVRSRVPHWQARVVALAEPFDPVAPPAAVRVVLGNRGGEDAWTHDPTTIALDVARLQREYGAASEAENGARIDRFFAHEFTHLMQKAWLPAHPQPMATPFELAELEMWTEGLGNWYSLSERWRSTPEGPSAVTRERLAALGPVLVERMRALACATPEESARLRADLSNGPFTRKWGALPVALWIEIESAGSPQARREFVRGGVDSVSRLARAHLPPDLAAALDRARERSRNCGG
jgi:hypothetical protein